jgi:hypothetical protein
MHGNKRIGLVFGILALSLTAAAGWAQDFSLDDDAAFPGSFAPATPPFRSAEDRWGIGLVPGVVGPSPSLGLWGLVGSDILPPGLAPVFGTAPLWEIDGLSSNHRPWLGLPLRVRFSVDRVTSGIPGSATNAQFALRQQPGDIFSSNLWFPEPCTNFAGMLAPVFGTFAGFLPSAGVGGNNFLVTNQGAMGLLTGGAIVGPAVAAPPIGNGTHDNVDAYNDMPGPMDPDGDNLPNFDIYYTLAPVEAVLNARLPAAIFFNPAGVAVFPPAIPPFAAPPALGLDIFGGVNTDDIDGLVVWDRPPYGSVPFGGPGAQPGFDCAIFSLSPGSATLITLQAAGIPVESGTVFFTDFSGLFGAYLTSNDLGLRSPFGGRAINVDALETRN